MLGTDDPIHLGTDGRINLGADGPIHLPFWHSYAEKRYSNFSRK